MNRVRTIAAAILAAFATQAVSAQVPTRPTAPAVAPGGNGVAVQDSRVATIDRGAFRDPRAGIVRLVNAWRTLEREFQPRQDEIQAMGTRYEALLRQIEASTGVSTPAAISQLVEQAEALKRDRDRRQDDAQAALRGRVSELIGPIDDDIARALQAFSRARGIAILFDLSKMNDMVMVFSQGADVTQAFIADYNQRNPAAAGR
jgi:Skp family chaperone for outer membrane proteins